MGNMVLVILAVVAVYFIQYIMREYDYSYFLKSRCRILFTQENAERFKLLLRTNFIVYKLLNEKGQRQFEKRVCRFISRKTFRAGHNLPEITDDMRVMVAASAIQITYGYPEVYFNHFQTIILFADDYYSSITGNYHEGEVNAGGAIVLSWRSFLSGFSDMKDGKNLALHEMAHALRLTNIVDNDEYDFLDRLTMQDFENQAMIEMQKIIDGKNPFFRSYGATNTEEFFSVAVECFFEQPAEFKEYNQTLYSVLSKILKLDLLELGKG
jgi:Mlc titration factor MtfA (ptsG expression regulator)